MKFKRFRVGNTERKILLRLQMSCHYNQSKIPKPSYSRRGIISIFFGDNPTVSQTRIIYRAVTKLKKKELITIKKGLIGISGQGKGFLLGEPKWEWNTDDTLWHYDYEEDLKENNKDIWEDVEKTLEALEEFSVC